MKIKFDNYYLDKINTSTEIWGTVTEHQIEPTFISTFMKLRDYKSHHENLMGFQGKRLSITIEVMGEQSNDTDETE